MANIYTGYFTLDHTATTQAITGVGFQPTAIFFYAVNSSWTGSGMVQANGFYGISYGIAANDGNQAYQCRMAHGGVDNHAAGRRYGHQYAMVRNPPSNYSGTCGEAVWWGQIDGAFTVQSYDADGFTIYNDIDFCADWIVQFMAIKAPNAAIVYNTAPVSTTGNQSYTGVGFEPDCLISLEGYSTVLDTYQNDCLGGIGITDGSSSFASDCYDQNGVGAVNAHRTANNTNFINFWMATRGDIVSLDADGFTINWKEAAAAAYYFATLCLGGVNAYVGSIQTETVTTDVAETGVGFQPDGLLFFTEWGYNTEDAYTGTWNEAIGTATATDERNCLSYEMINGSTVASDVTASRRYDQILDQNNNQTVISEMDLVSIDEDGFTYKMDDADSSNKIVFYLALQVIETDYRSRLVKYLHNTYQSGRRGKTVVRDVVGRDLPPTQIDPDNWLFSGGQLWPSPVKYSNLLEDPNTFYVESIKPSEDSVDIETNRESFFDSIMRKLTNK